MPDAPHTSDVAHGATVCTGAGTGASLPLFVGLDPGEQTGLAAFCPRSGGRPGAFVLLETAGPLATVRRLESLAHLGHVAGDGQRCHVAGVWIEDARGLPLYARHRHLPREARDRAARSVGRVDALTALYAELCAGLGAEAGFPVQLVEPGRAGKWDAEAFRRLTGHAGRCSQHARDAARLVWGRTAARAAPTLGL